MLQHPYLHIHLLIMLQTDILKMLWVNILSAQYLPLSLPPHFSLIRFTTGKDFVFSFSVNVTAAAGITAGFSGTSPSFSYVNSFIIDDNATLLCFFIPALVYICEKITSCSICTQEIMSGSFFCTSSFISSFISY